MEAQPTTPTQREPDRSGDVIILLLALGVIVLSLILNVPAGGERVSLTADGSLPLPPICLMRSVTGLPCPSCGLTRSFITMAHLDIDAARHFHHIGPGLFVFVLLQLPYRGLRLTLPVFRTRTNRYDLRLNATILLAMVGLLTINWVIYLVLHLTA